MLFFITRFASSGGLERNVPCFRGVPVDKYLQTLGVCSRKTLCDSQGWGRIKGGRQEPRLWLGEACEPVLAPRRFMALRNQLYTGDAESTERHLAGLGSRRQRPRWSQVSGRGGGVACPQLRTRSRAGVGRPSAGHGLGCEHQLSGW